MLEAHFTQIAVKMKVNNIQMGTFDPMGMCQADNGFQSQGTVSMAK